MRIEVREAYPPLTALRRAQQAAQDDAAVTAEHEQKPLVGDPARLTAAPHGAVIDYGDPASALDGVLWPIVRSARELLTSSRLERLGQCPGDECGWLFLDTSRSGRRHWCDMKDCGNVAKVRRFREKARDDHSVADDKR